MRYPLLDTIRAIAVISMILYHAMWDIVFIFGQNITWFSEWPGFLWEQSICWTFILLSGFCQNLSKHGYRDGLLISACGLLVTLVSIIFQIGMEIYFGILTFLGLAILIVTALKRIIEELNPYISLIVSFILFLFTYNVREGYLGFDGFKLLIPEILYNNSLGVLFNLIGFPQLSFSSGDYFPLIPWIFLFLTGFYTGKIFLEKKAMQIFEEGRIPVLDWIGRHSLLIYLIHQPVIYLVLQLFYK